MKNTFKRFGSLLIALAIACALSVGVFAEEMSPTTSTIDTSISATAEGDAVSRASLGPVLATNAGTIYGGSGKLTVTLTSGNFWADLVAGIGYTDQSGVVTCSVVTPSGDEISLGSISGSGSRTASKELGYAPAGTYTFYFFSAITTPYEVVAYIYD